MKKDIPTKVGVGMMLAYKTGLEGRGYPPPPKLDDKYGARGPESGRLFLNSSTGLSTSRTPAPDSMSP